MSDDDRYEGVVIVFEGSINPAIFTVAWMSAQDLVDPQEAGAAQVYFSDPDLSRFDISGFRVEARRDRVTVGSARALESHWPVSDFVKGIFEVLCHTPINALAISKAVHIDLPPGAWESLMTTLVPPAPWTELSYPSLQVLSMTGVRDDPRPGRIEVTVEESQHVAGGVYIVATERLEFENAMETGRGARDAVDALEERWGPWLSRADRIIESIRSLA